MDKQNDLKLVKLTKQEKEKEKADKKQAKKDALEKIPEKDREKQKKYKKKIYMTLVVFVLALGTLALTATNLIDTTIAIWILIAMCVISTVISRSEK